MYNRRYEKVFLMLRQETAGYAVSKRPPWGSCVMELKNGQGRLHLTVQGLKPFGRGYGVYVLAGEETIFCGELHPEKKEGRCELKWDFAPDAIGKGKRAEDLHTVLVIAEGTSAPLAAYFKEKRNWKQIFHPRKKGTVSEGIALQAAEAAVAERPMIAIVPEKTEEKQEEPVHQKVEKEEKQSYHGSFQGLLEKFRQELEELEETGILSPAEVANIRSQGAAAPSPVKEKAAEEEKAPLFATNRELSPFEDGEAWKCLSLEELTLLAQIPLKWQKEFFFLLPYRRYHHLILQEKENGVWLGLPNHYTEEDAADAAAFGFREFRKVEENWGYWMAFLEREA